MTQIKIDKGVPIPAPNFGPISKYPFTELEVGDSFFVKEKQTVMASACAGHGKRHNKKFTTRSENGGTRVWRVA
jgi:hypothetical protein